MAENINGLFEALSPSQKQKNKMLNEIQSNVDTEDKNSDKRPRLFVRLPKPLTAVIVFALILVSVGITVNAATDGEFVSSIIRIVFQDGNESEMQYTSEDTAAMSAPADQVPNWLVSESSEQQLILELNGESINITDDMNQKGYYYYDFISDDDGLLHAIYIVKNAGEEGTERWYSQMEYIPEHHISRRKGCSYPLGVLIAFVDSDIKDGLGTLDSEMPQALNLYREIMEAEARTELTETDKWNKIDARWGEWRD